MSRIGLPEPGAVSLANLIVGRLFGSSTSRHRGQRVVCSRRSRLRGNGQRAVVRGDGRSAVHAATTPRCARGQAVTVSLAFGRGSRETGTTETTSFGRPAKENRAHR